MGIVSQMGMFDIGVFLNNLGNKIGSWGSGICFVLGAAMVLVAIFKIAKGLMSERSQTNWVMCFVLLFVGGLLAGTGAYGFFNNFATGGGNDLKALGGE